MRKIPIEVLFFSMLSLNACGHISFYDNEKGEGSEVGVKFYTPKPYILVSRTQSKDNPVKIEVVYLPDLSKPTYAKAIAGFGSSDLSMTFSNGTLASFGQKTDPKIAETLSAIGGLVTSGGGLATSLATAAKTRAEANQLSEQALDISDGNRLKQIASGILSILRDSSARSLTPSEVSILESARSQLESLGSQIVSPGQPPNPESVATALNDIIEKWDNGIRKVSPVTEGPIKIFFDKIAQIRTEIGDIAKKSKPAPISLPSITLYEVDNSSGTTLLREVSLQ